MYINLIINEVNPEHLYVLFSQENHKFIFLYVMLISFNLNQNGGITVEQKKS